MTEAVFELVKEDSDTGLGFELGVNLAKHGELRDGATTLFSGCTTIGEFQTRLDELVQELHLLLLDAEEVYADAPGKPRNLGLGG